MFGCFVKLTLNALNAWEVWNLRHLCLAQENNVGLQDFSSFVELFFLRIGPPADFTRFSEIQQ